MSENKEGIYEFFVDFGRMGEIEGVFIAWSEDIAKAIASCPELYLGEALGKHSEIVVSLKAEHIILKSDNTEVVSVVKDLFGHTVSGYNPLDYVEDF